MDLRTIWIECPAAFRSSSLYSVGLAADEPRKTGGGGPSIFCLLHPLAFLPPSLPFQPGIPPSRSGHRLFLDINPRQCSSVPVLLRRRSLSPQPPTPDPRGPNYPHLWVGCPAHQQTLGNANANTVIPSCLLAVFLSPLRIASSWLTANIPRGLCRACSILVFLTHTSSLRLITLQAHLLRSLPFPFPPRAAAAVATIVLASSSS